MPIIHKVYSNFYYVGVAYRSFYALEKEERGEFKSLEDVMLFLRTLLCQNTLLTGIVK